LRELIIPDALAQAVSVVGAGVGVGGKKGKTSRVEDGLADSPRGEEARKELDELVAGVCPLCEGAVVGIDRPFVVDGEDVGEWDV
jgi:hypothetical protein